MATLDAAHQHEGDRCRWHTLAKDLLPFKCTRPARPGRATCSQHSAELDLRAFEAATPEDCSWLIYWSTGFRRTRRGSAAHVAEMLFDREPDGLLEQGGDRRSMELRVHGKLVAIVRRVAAGGAK